MKYTKLYPNIPKYTKMYENIHKNIPQIYTTNIYHKKVAPDYKMNAYLFYVNEFDVSSSRESNYR